MSGAAAAVARIGLLLGLGLDLLGRSGVLGGSFLALVA